MTIDARRFAFVYSMMLQGWDAEGPAAQVAWALHPFDDFPVPPRKMEKEVRKRNRAFAKELKPAKHDAVRSAKIALRATNDYVEIARSYGAQHFVDRWSLLKSELEAKVADHSV